MNIFWTVILVILWTILVLSAGYLSGLQEGKKSVPTNVYTQNMNSPSDILNEVEKTYLKIDTFLKCEKDRDSESKETRAQIESVGNTYRNLRAAVDELKNQGMPQSMANEMLGIRERLKRVERKSGMSV